MRYVPMLMAVDTDSDDEAKQCARILEEHGSGESFSFAPLPVPTEPGGILVMSQGGRRNVEVRT